MKNLTYTSLIICLLGVFTSCSKWLEVQPEDRFTEEQIFANAQGFEEAINGVYLKMANNNLYGYHLSMGTVELLAQRYAVTSSETNSKYRIANFQYDQDVVKNVFDAIWQEAYGVVGNVNQLLKNLDKYKDNISVSRANIMKGEALALRAYLHFDMLRLFGPIYELDSTKVSIPYYTELKPALSPLEPANIILDKVLDDLNAGIKLLEQDQIHQAATEGVGVNARYRMNYYAAVALKARVLLWRGDREGALRAATEVIQADNKFPWVVRTAVTADPANANRVFHTEMLFSSYVSQLYQNFDSNFSDELDASNILSAGTTTFISYLYENITADYRFSSLWPVSATLSVPTFIKYRDVVNKTTNPPQRFNVPLIRKSEMYYIAAECEPDMEIGLVYLNVVRNIRGLNSLTSAANLYPEIRKEYMKEFYGEGQVWYYYKRNRITSVMSPANFTTGVSIPLNAYVLPLPEEELMNR